MLQIVCNIELGEKPVAVADEQYRKHNPHLEIKRRGRVFPD